MRRAGDRRARGLEALLTRPTGILGALLIGNNALNFIMTAATTASLASAGWSHPDWWATLALSPVLLVVAEMTPKDVAQRRADVWMLRASHPLTALRWTLAPIVAPLVLIERMLGRSRDAGMLSRGRLRALMLQGVQEGVLSAEQHELANRVMRFADLTVDLVAVPWHRAITVPAGANREAILAVAKEHQLTRLPVVAGESGKIVGVISVDQLVFEPNAELQTLVQPLVTLGPDVRASDALNRLGGERQHLALIGTDTEPIGLLTLADLMAALVGASHGLVRRPESVA